jgi:dTDP-4-amino-4,6-dideoxygalactose transaminase
MTDWTARRQANAAALVEALKPFSGPKGVVRLPRLGCNGCAKGCGPAGVEGCAVGCTHAQYKLYVYVQAQNLAPGWSRDQIIAAINAQGVPCFQGSCSEVYLEKAFDNTGWRPELPLPVAKQLGETSMMFLVHPTLTESNMAKVVSVLKQVLSQAQS